VRPAARGFIFIFAH